MRKQDYKQEDNAKVLKKVWRNKALDCSHCLPNRNENAKRRPKHGTRPSKSKQVRRK